MSETLVAPVATRDYGVAVQGGRWQPLTVLTTHDRIGEAIRMRNTLRDGSSQAAAIVLVRQWRGEWLTVEDDPCLSPEEHALAYPVRPPKWRITSQGWTVCVRCDVLSIHHGAECQ